MASLPNGSAGLDTGAWGAHWVNQNDFSKLAHRTETEIRDYFNDLVQGSDPWIAAATAFFDGILKGFSDLNHFLASIVQSITGAVGAGFAELSTWATDRVNDGILAFQKIQDFIDSIVQGFLDTVSTGFGIPDVFDSIKGLLNVGRTAQLGADQANIGVQILKLERFTGVTGYDEFNYATAAALPSGTYTVATAGAGGGSYGPNGSGFLTWKPSGTGFRQYIYRHDASTLSTDYGVVTAVWARAVPSGMFYHDGYGYLCGRFNSSAMTNHVRARIGIDSVAVEAVVGGTVTTLGSAASVSTRDGDVWEFWYGDKALTDPYQFTVIQNGVTVLSVNDTGMVSVLETSLGIGDHRLCGFGGQADLFWPAFTLPAQAGPPVLAGWTWRDQ